jgi:hypothetical protein
VLSVVAHTKDEGSAQLHLRESEPSSEENATEDINSLGEGQDWSPHEEGALSFVSCDGGHLQTPAQGAHDTSGTQPSAILQLYKADHHGSERTEILPLHPQVVIPSPLQSSVMSCSFDTSKAKNRSPEDIQDHVLAMFSTLSGNSTHLRGDASLLSDSTPELADSPRDSQVSLFNEPEQARAHERNVTAYEVNNVIQMLNTLSGNVDLGSESALELDALATELAEAEKTQLLHLTNSPRLRDETFSSSDTMHLHEREAAGNDATTVIQMLNTLSGNVPLINEQACNEVGYESLKPVAVKDLHTHSEKEGELCTTRGFIETPRTRQLTSEHWLQLMLVVAVPVMLIAQSSINYRSMESVFPTLYRFGYNFASHNLSNAAQSPVWRDPNAASTMLDCVSEPRQPQVPIDESTEQRGTASQSFGRFNSSESDEVLTDEAPVLEEPNAVHLTIPGESQNFEPDISSVVELPVVMFLDGTYLPDDINLINNDVLKSNVASVQLLVELPRTPIEVTVPAVPINPLVENLPAEFHEQASLTLTQTARLQSSPAEYDLQADESSVPAYALLETISARVERLEHIVKDRADVVVAYRDMLLGTSSPIDSVSTHVWRMLTSRRLFPTSDRECRWNFVSERCEPACYCSWQFRFGDLTPSRSCRRREMSAAEFNGLDGVHPRRSPVRAAVRFGRVILTNVSICML